MTKMVMEKNNLNGNWMCYIPGVHDQMYAIPNKRDAKIFVNRVNNAIVTGKLIIVAGKLKKSEGVIK